MWRGTVIHTAKLNLHAPEALHKEQKSMSGIIYIPGRWWGRSCRCKLFFSMQNLDWIDTVLIIFLNIQNKISFSYNNIWLWFVSRFLTEGFWWVRPSAEKKMHQNWAHLALCSKRALYFKIFLYYLSLSVFLYITLLLKKITVHKLTFHPSLPTLL